MIAPPRIDEQFWVDYASGRKSLYELFGDQWERYAQFLGRNPDLCEAVTTIRKWLADDIDVEWQYGMPPLRGPWRYRMPKDEAKVLDILEGNHPDSWMGKLYFRPVIGPLTFSEDSPQSVAR